MAMDLGRRTHALVCAASVFCVWASGIAPSECDASPSAAGGAALLQSKSVRVRAAVSDEQAEAQSEIKNQVANDPLQGQSSSSVATCPGDVTAIATNYWKDYFEDRCEVAWDDVSTETKERILQSVSTPVKRPNGTMDSNRCEVLATLPGPNGELSSGDISFEIVPPVTSPTDDNNWIAVTSSGKFQSHLNCTNPCNIFSQGVPRLRPMSASRIQEVFDQLKLIYSDQCGEEDMYKLSLKEDSSKPMKKVKQHMTEANGKYGFSFDLDLYVDEVAEPMSTHIKVTADPVDADQEASIAAEQLEEQREAALQAQEQASHNGTDLMQKSKGWKLGGKRLNGLSIILRRAGQAPLPSCQASSAWTAPSELPVTGPWTVDVEELQPPLCCLCGSCVDPTVCTEGGALENNGTGGASLLAANLTLHALESVMEFGRRVWKHPAPRGIVPAHGSKEARSPPVRHGNHFTADGRPVVRTGPPNRNPRWTGDTFHSAILPKRTPEDHERIWAQSRALIAIVKSELKEDAIPESYNYFDDETRSQCWQQAYNQGECGSCWSFASLGALEKQMCMRAGASLVPSLSREMLVRCSEQNGACGGGNADKAYEDLMEIGGVFSTDCLPYQGKGSKHCPGFAYSWFGQAASGQTGKFVRIDQELQQSCGDFTRYTNRPPMGQEWDMPFSMMYEQRFGIPLTEDALDDERLALFKKNYAKSRSRDNVASFWVYGEEAMRAAVLKYGSIYASYQMMDDFTKKRMCDTGCWPPGTVWGEEAYILSSGVFQASSCKGESGHAVHIVGFGEEIQETGLRVPYWLIENSWGSEDYQDLLGGNDVVTKSFQEDPWTELHQMNAEDECIIAGWGNSFTKDNIRDDIEIEGGEPDGFWLSLKIDGQEVFNQSFAPGTFKLFKHKLKLEAGDHSITFGVYAGSHPLQQATEIEKYSIVAPKMRCRGKGFRYSFHQNDTQASLDWGRMTRSQLRARADEIMQAAGVDPSARLAECPEACRTGSFSEVHPCLGLLMSWGSCYTDDWMLAHSYYQTHAAHDCQKCDQMELLQQEQQVAVQNLDSATFDEWHGLVMEAFDAPDEPGWMRLSFGSCEIQAAGFKKNCKLSATYAFTMPYGSDGNGGCDETHSAPFEQGRFVSAPGYMTDGSNAETRCPMPMKGSVTLKCAKGVLSVTDHNCQGRGDTLTSNGYFRMLRGHNYHGIEEGGAFAMAEMSRFMDLCPTAGWSKWSECTATEPCSKGTQSRSRQPVSPLTAADSQCSSLVFHEERACVAPGMCPQVLARMIGSGVSDISGFLNTYKKESTTLPYQTAGAHMLDTAHQTCENAQYWCKLITGSQACGMFFEGHIEVKKSAEYFLRYDADEGEGELRFNQLGEGNELKPQYKVTHSHGTSTLYEWQDLGFHHRRRRTDTQPWEQISSLHLDRGTYFARMTRVGWSSCPTFNLKLEQASTTYTAPILHATMQASADGNGGAAASEEAVWDNTWGTVSSWILQYREDSYRRRRGTAAAEEKGFENEIVLRDEYGGTVLGKASVNKLKFTADELYELLGVENRQNPEGVSSYKRMELVIRSTVILAEEGTYKFKYQQDTSADETNVAWRSASRRRSTKVMMRVGGDTYASFDSWVGSATVLASHTVDASGTTTVEVSALMGYDGINDKFTLPNFIELEMKREDLLHGSTLDFGTVTNHLSNLEAISGSNNATITWPDRDNPLDTELRLSSYQALPRDTLLVGEQGMAGFMAHTEGVIDAGACLSLQARVPDAFPGQFGGLALELCDVDGTEQYLELVVYKVAEDAGAAGSELEKLERERVGWVHIGFTQPTHLKIVRRPSDLSYFEVSYRPDDRLEFAYPFNEDKVKAATNGHTGVMDVGVSMFTPESYRYAEFYNISVSQCQGSCDSGGTQVHCGNLTTACGDVLDCGSTCPNSGICQDNLCMDCPELVIAGTEMESWECGLATQVCTDPTGRSIQVHREVGGAAPSPRHQCHEHQWTCYGMTSWAYMAQGMQCGSVTNECEETIRLPDCQKQNDVCAEHTCVCAPTVFPSDYNCGWTGDGCGTRVIFGDPKVAELQLTCEASACMQVFNDISGWSTSALEGNTKYISGDADVEQTLAGEFEAEGMCSDCGVVLEGWLKAPETAEFSFIVKENYAAKVYAATVPDSMKTNDLQVAYEGTGYGYNHNYGSNKFSWEQDKHYYVRALVQASWSQVLSVGLKQEDGGPEWMPLPLTMFEVPMGLCPQKTDVCNNHRCCTPLAEADFSGERSCGNASDGCGGLVLFGDQNGGCPVLQQCNHETFTCEQGDVSTLLFAVVTKSACAENLPYGPDELTDASASAYVSTAHKDQAHSSWIQIVQPYGTPDPEVDFSITYVFPDTKTLKERMESITVSGEAVQYTVQSADGDVFHINGTYYFSNGAYMSGKMDSSGSTRFSSDDGAWGAGSGNVNGNGWMPGDFWGVANWNSGDSGCSEVYRHGMPFSSSGEKEMNVKTFVYMQV